MSALTAHQVVHGYRDGHRLLVASLEPTAEERRDLDLLSDQSGTLDRAVDYAWYDTGYPNGRWYVLARTWIDREAERRGTVWTHSLLIPIDRLDELDELEQVHTLFRQPTRPFRPEEWRTELRIPPPARSVPPLTPQHAWAWFLRDERPLLWEDPDTAVAAIRALWARMPASSRAGLRFCTFSLQPRYHRDDLVDWQAPAPRSDAAWYRTRDRAISPQRGYPGVIPGIELVTGAPEAVRALWLGLPGFEPRPTAVRVLLRFLSLAGRQDLPGALVRLDCVEALAVAGRSLAADAVGAALTALAALPSPSFLDVRNVVTRAPHRLDPASRERVEDTVFAVLADRVDLASEGFASLVSDADRTGLAPQVWAGLGARLARTPAPAAADWILAHTKDGAHLARLLDPHPEGATIAAAAYRNRTHAEAAWAWLMAEPGRVADAVRVEPELLGRVLEADTEWSGREWAAILEQVPAAAVKAHLRPTLSFREEIVRRLSELPPADVAELPEPWRSACLWSRAELEPDRVANHLDVAADLLQTSPAHPAAAALARAVVKQHAPSALLGAFATPPGGEVCRRVIAGGAAAAVVDQALEGLLEPAEAVEWLLAADGDLPHSATVRLLEPPPGALSLATVIVAAVPDLWSGAFLDRCWRGWTRRPTPETVDALDGWISLIERLRGEAKRAASSAGIGRAIKGHAPAFGRLAAVCFPAIHDALKEDDRRPMIVRWIEEFWGLDWDRAKHLRRAAAAAWLAQGWSNESLVAMADGDAGVFGKLCERVAQEGGRSRLREFRTEGLPRGFAEALRQAL